MRQLNVRSSGIIYYLSVWLEDRKKECGSLFSPFHGNTDLQHSAECSVSIPPPKLHLPCDVSYQLFPHLWRYCTQFFLACLFEWLHRKITFFFFLPKVILPMAGYSIRYPNNKVGEWYRERLASDGIQTCTFRLPALQLNVPGCYRYLLKYPHNLSYRFLAGDQKETRNGDSPHQDSEDSLSLSFWLDPSCYATVCLKEIMKCDLQDAFSLFLYAIKFVHKLNFVKFYTRKRF